MKLMAAGDQVLVAEFGDRIDEAVNDQVHALAAKIEEQQIPGIGEVVPTFRSLLIYYDSYQLSYQRQQRQHFAEDWRCAHGVSDAGVPGSAGWRGGCDHPQAAHQCVSLS